MKRVLLIILVVVTLMTIPFSVSAQDVKESIAEYYEDEETGLTLPYRLIIPEIYDKKYSFPLVVFFHGAGERGFENERQLDHCVQQIADNMPKAIILVPQCSHKGQWVDTPWEDGSYSTDEIPESDELEAVMSLVGQIMQDYSIDKETVYAMGISMGGFAVWDVMIRHNDVFAAGVAVCGAGDPSKAEILKDTPMFVFHGTADDAVPVSGSTDMVEAIQAIGGTKAQYTEFYGAGHGIWGQVFNMRDLYSGIKKCKLSDHYIPKQEDPPKTEYWPYLVAGSIAVLAIAFSTVLFINYSRKKRKS